MWQFSLGKQTQAQAQQHTAASAAADGVASSNVCGLAVGLCASATCFDVSVQPNPPECCMCPGLNGDGSNQGLHIGHKGWQLYFYSSRGILPAIAYSRRTDGWQRTTHHSVVNCWLDLVVNALVWCEGRLHWNHDMACSMLMRTHSCIPRQCSDHSLRQTGGHALQQDNQPLSASPAAVAA